MKALLALLLLGLILGFGYWKNENPDATFADFQTGANNGLARLKNGFDAVKDGGPASKPAIAEETLNARLDSIESELVEVQRAADPSVVNGRLAEAEGRISASENQLSNALAQITSAEGKLSALEEKTNSTTDIANNALAQASAADEQLQAFKNEINSLSEEVKTASTQTPAAEQQLNAFRTELDNLSSEVAASANKAQLSGQLENFSRQISANSTTQSEQSRELETQSTQLAALSEKIDAFDARINTLSFDASNGQEEAVASLTAQLDQRIASLESKLQTANTDSQRISLLESNLGSVKADQQRITQLETKLDSANATINELQNALNAANADARQLESLSNELAASRVRMAAMESEASEIGQQLVVLTQSIDSLKAQAETNAIDEQQNAIRAQLEQLQAQLDNAQLSKSDTATTENNAEVVALMAELEATRNRIQSLEQRVVDLPDTAEQQAGAMTAQNALQQQIADLERKIQESGGTVDPELASTISAVEEKVSEIASKGYVTQEELRAQQTAESIEYKIYFDRNSTDISDDAAKVLNSFIAQEKNRTTGISIFGFTDRRGSASYNQQLALKRAANVRSYLIQKGFSFTKIKSISGLGEDAAAVNLEDGAEDAQQRFVVIYADQP
jgi:outer membrane protein OmpA-like peptidoglycan-associated protein